MIDEQQKRDHERKMNKAIAFIEGVIDDILMDAHHENRDPLTAHQIVNETSLVDGPHNHRHDHQLIACVATIMEQKGCLTNHAEGNSIPRWSTTGTLYGRESRVNNQRFT